MGNKIQLILISFLLIGCSVTVEKNANQSAEKIKATITQKDDKKLEKNIRNFLFNYMAGFSKVKGTSELIAPYKSQKLISNKFVFKGNSWEINERYKRYLRKLAKLIDSAEYVLVTGHTDRSGPQYYNQILSVKRAQTVAKFLVKVGVKKEKIYYRGLGETQPLFAKSEKNSEQKNRGFEIDIMNSIEGVQAFSEVSDKNDPGFVFYVMDKTYADDYFSPTKNQRYKKNKKKSINSLKFSPLKKKPQFKKVYVKPISVKPVSVKPVWELSGYRVWGTKNPYFKKIDFSPPTNNNGIISDAQASATPFKQSCVAGGVGLSNTPQKDIKDSVYTLINVDGRVWYSNSVNGKKLSILNLALHRESKWISSPVILISEDRNILYEIKPQKIDALMGKKGVLVRMIFERDAPFECVDIVFDLNDLKKKTFAKVYYKMGSEYFAKELTLVFLSH